MPFRRPAMVLATWFGIGLLPFAPGTWASLAALPCAWALVSIWGHGGLAVAAGAVFALGCWAASRVEAASTGKDPGIVVIDEIAGQWLVLLVAPLSLLAYGLAFVLFRFFDIVKPFPVSWADRRVKGGFGIMLDDVLAALYAALLLWIIAGAIGVRP